MLGARPIQVKGLFPGLAWPAGPYMLDPAWKALQADLMLTQGSKIVPGVMK